MNVFPYKIKMNIEHKYCCYLTIYLGKLLPPFYLGSTSVKKINDNYHGSASSKKWSKKYQQELKNNPKLFKTIILRTTKTRKVAMGIELFLQKKNNVVNSNFFFNEAYATKNGCFGRDVSGENNGMFGKNHTKESKKKMSDNNKTPSGDANPMFGKNAYENKTEEEMKVIGDKISAKCSGENNSFFGETHTDKTKKKMRKPKSKSGRQAIGDSRRKIMEMMPIVTCPHCKKDGKKQPMHQWHFKNCKLNDTYWEEW